MRTGGASHGVYFLAGRVGRGNHCSIQPDLGLTRVGFGGSDFK